MKDSFETGWEVVKLGEVCQKMQTTDPRKHPDKTFRYIDVSGVSNKTFTIEATQDLVGQEAPSRARRVVHTGNVIFATIRPTLMRVAQVPEDLDGAICSTGYIVLKPTERVAPRFLFYSLFRSDFIDEMEALQSGASYPAVTDKHVLQHEISLPPLEEQKRIVAVLDQAFAALDRALAHAEANLADAGELFDNSLLAMFESLLTTSELMTLSEAAVDFSRGKSRHRPRNDPKLYDGEYPFIQTGDIRRSSGSIREYAQTYNDVGLAQSKLWPAGTVCITIAANIAETGVLEFEGCFPDSVIGMVPDPNKTNAYYVEYMLRFFAKELKLQGKGSAQDNINLSTFENARFPVPALEAQTAVVEKLDSIAAEVTTLKSNYYKLLADIADLRQSLLQKAFSGQLTA